MTYLGLSYSAPVHCLALRINHLKGWDKRKYKPSFVLLYQYGGCHIGFDFYQCDLCGAKFASMMRTVFSCQTSLNGRDGALLISLSPSPFKWRYYTDYRKRCKGLKWTRSRHELPLEHLLAKY